MKSKQQNDSYKAPHLIRRFISYYKPHKWMFVLDMLSSFLVSAIGMIYPIITRIMLNDLIPNKKIRLVVYAGLLVLFLYFVRYVLRYFVQYYGHMIGVRMQAHMRRDMFIHLEKLPYSYYDNHETGKIMSRMTNDLMNVSELAHHGPENLLISGVMIIASFIYLWTIEPYLTLIIFACLPILITVSALCRFKMKEAFTERRTSVAEINASLESSISGIRVTKAFTNSEKEIEKFNHSNGLFVTACKKAYRAMAQFFSSTSLITDVFNVIIIIAGGFFLHAGKITFGDYSTFIVSVNLFLEPVRSLIQFMEMYQDGVTGFQRFLEIIDTPPESDCENPITLKNIEGKIEFKSVSFSYDKEKGVLDNVSLTIPAGKKVALVGPSGGGKTTLCHLLPRFYPMEDGEILIDGQNINSISLESLRSNIGIVQQDVFLFNGTMRENILYGKLDATEDEMILAAKRANIHDYIMTLEKGYDTEIGERGVRLSGGQKQRLSIARFFLKDPAILILDEATSALDNTTEIMIQNALDELCKGRTTLVVAHRLSTIKNADSIVVVSDGKIIENGTHQQLMQENGIYKKLYLLQFRNSDT